MSIDVDALCICGRRSYRVHCPSCGLRAIYCFAKTNLVTRADGTDVVLKTYKCRSCGRRFNDDDWKLRCMAPSPSKNHNSIASFMADVIEQATPLTEAQKVFNETGDRRKAIDAAIEANRRNKSGPVKKSEPQPPIAMSDDDDSSVLDAEKSFFDNHFGASANKKEDHK